MIIRVIRIGTVTVRKDLRFLYYKLSCNILIKLTQVIAQKISILARIALGILVKYTENGTVACN